MTTLRGERSRPSSAAWNRSCVVRCNTSATPVVLALDIGLPKATQLAG